MIEEKNVLNEARSEFNDLPISVEDYYCDNIIAVRLRRIGLIVLGAGIFLTCISFGTTFYVVSSVLNRLNEDPGIVIILSSISAIIVASIVFFVYFVFTTLFKAISEVVQNTEDIANLTHCLINVMKGQKQNSK